MDWAAALWLLLGGTTVLLFLGIPVAYSFFAINIVGAIIFLGGEAGLTQLIRNSVLSVAKFSLVPIPLFILMGEVLFHSGLAQKSIAAIEKVIPAIPGRLAVIAVVAGTVFSAISGSTIATTAMLGSLMVPMMLEKGYSARFSMGPVMAIGGVDMLIPPSALAVLLGSLSGISISKLLIGGVVPGLVLAVAYVVFIVGTVYLRPHLAPPDVVSPYQGWKTWVPFIKYVAPLSLVFGVIVWVISAGIASPTEASAIGAGCTVLLAALYGVLRPKVLMSSLLGTVMISGMILFIIVGATTFSQVLSFSGATNGLVELITNSSLDKLTIVVVMMLILILLGLFVDQVSTMLLTLPFYMLLVHKFDIDKVWFGVMFLVCMQIGLLMPPHGLLLFTMKSVAPKHITMLDVYVAALPYVTLTFLMLVAIFFWPSLATWLPGLLVR